MLEIITQTGRQEAGMHFGDVGSKPRNTKLTFKKKCVFSFTLGMCYDVAATQGNCGHHSKGDTWHVGEKNVMYNQYDKGCEL